MKIVNVQEMRRIEQAADAGGFSFNAMMEAAGRAVADAAISLGMLEPEGSALVLVGPGNNGGDGLVAARYLRESGHEVVIYIWKRNIKGDENFRLLKRRRRGIAILWAENDPDFAKLREEVSRTSVIIDALLGTGVDRPLDARLRELLTTVQQEVDERRQLEAEETGGSFDHSSFPIVEALMLGASSARADTEPTVPDVLMDSHLASGSGTDHASASAEEIEEIAGDLSDDLDESWFDEIDEAEWPPAPVLAVDCPSGLNCDTGEIDPAALRAQLTATFGYAKWGQVQYPGAQTCGVLYVSDIGLPARLAEAVAVDLVGPEDMQQLLPHRDAGSHKGSFGKVLAVGGSLNYTGAIVLAGAAAVRIGAGLVMAAIPLPLHAAVAGQYPELTWLPLASNDDGTHTAKGAARLIERAAGYDALLIGPGLTSSRDAAEFLTLLTGPGGLDRNALEGRTIFDADALNILATLPDWWKRVPQGSILTPHPGEMGRLTGMSARDVNVRRIEHARRWAAEWGHIVLLKGPHTVVAAPDGRTHVLPFATSALATAGSGDVLAGAIAGLLAQGLAAFDAAVLGAYLHGFSGVLLEVATHPAGVFAREIVQKLPEALRLLAHGEPD